MPKVPVDYSKTIIYKLVCNDVDVTDIYVGHTTNFIKRRTAHKSKCNNIRSEHYNLYVYKFIRENGGWFNWSMIEIEQYYCNNLREACVRERYYIELLSAKLNKSIPSRSKKEYRKIYEEKHKEYLQQYNKITHANYYQKNKETFIEKAKEYYKDNYDAIKQRTSQKFLCDCGGKYRLGDKSHHFRTVLHQNYINGLNECSEYMYTWDDGTPCTQEDYENSLL